MTHTEHIEISVVIPTYNRRQILRDMLEALAKQTLPPQKFEVIVVIDGSTDGTSEMLEAIHTPYSLRSAYQDNAGRDSKVFSSGVSVARNRGASLARGSVVLFLDDDLLPVPELLEAHARIHRKSPTAVVLGRLLPSDDMPNKRGWNEWEERALAKHYRLMESGERPPAGWRLYSANFSVGLELFRKVDGFDLEMGHIRGEDVELGFRFEDEGAKFYFAHDGAAVHRGFRTFASWCNSAYILGVRDVALARDKGRSQLLSRVLGGYKRKSLPVRLAVKLSLTGKPAKSVLVRLLRFGAGVFSWLRVRQLSHAGYTMIYSINYWSGVADSVGDRPSLERSFDGNFCLEAKIEAD